MDDKEDGRHYNDWISSSNKNFREEGRSNNDLRSKTLLKVTCVREEMVGNGEASVQMSKH